LELPQKFSVKPQGVFIAPLGFYIQFRIHLPLVFNSISAEPRSIFWKKIAASEFLEVILKRGYLQPVHQAGSKEDFYNY